jgi:hypothetical protein
MGLTTWSGSARICVAPPDLPIATSRTRHAVFGGRGVCRSQWMIAFTAHRTAWALLLATGELTIATLLTATVASPTSL